MYASNEASAEAINALFMHIDAAGDGLMDYNEFAEWLCSSGIPLSNAMSQLLHCPDGHNFQQFSPQVDGWCCEECGEDLLANQEVLQCAECDGQCWCIQCSLQQSDVRSIEELALAACQAFIDRWKSSRTTGEQEEQAADDDQLPAEEEHGADDEQLPATGPICLNIRSLAGELFCSVDADKSWKVIHLKTVVHTQTNIAAVAQTLIFGCSALQDDDFLGVFPSDKIAEVTLLQRSAQQVTWLLAIQQDSIGMSLLANAPESIREDDLVVHEAVSKVGLDLQYAAENLRADQKIVLAASKQNVTALIHASPELLADRSFGLVLVDENGMSLGYLPEHLRLDYEVVKTAVTRKGCGIALRYVSEDFPLDTEILDLAFKNGFTLDSRGYRWVGGRHEWLRDHRVVALAAARHSVSELRQVSPRLLADRWFALDALQVRNENLQVVAAAIRDYPALRDDKEVLAAAVRKGLTLRHSPESIRSNRNVVYQVVQHSGMELEYASNQLRADRRIVHAAVQQCGLALKFAAFQLRNEDKIVESAVQQNSHAIRFAGAHLKNSMTQRLALSEISKG